VIENPVRLSAHNAGRVVQLEWLLSIKGADLRNLFEAHKKFGPAAFI
jgi:hypothetical protein